MFHFRESLWFQTHSDFKRSCFIWIYMYVCVSMLKQCTYHSIFITFVGNYMYNKMLFKPFKTNVAFRQNDTFVSVG